MLVHDYLTYFSRQQPEVPCAIQHGRELTYRQLESHCARLANALLDAGLTKGDRFGFLDRNSIEGVIVYMAGSMAGLVPVPLNWRLAPQEWQYILSDAGAVAIICEAEFCGGIDSIRNELNCVRDYISINGADSPDWCDFYGFYGAQPSTHPTNRADDRDVFYQMYTSGTTGKPKGAMLTHYSVISNAMQTQPFFRESLGPGRKTLIVMPMFHAGATSFVIGSIAAGATMVIHREFSAEGVADALSGDDITVVNLVPAMIQAMLTDVANIRERDFSALQAIIYGASSISEHTLREAIATFSCDFYQGFGQTESSAVITFMTADDHRAALSGKTGLLLSAGRPVVGTEVRIVDANNRELPAGESGEITMRGPQIMKGYCNLPDATAEAIRDGWLYTGDVGKVDEDGYLYVQDRTKDMIITGGENVYPREVENVLFEHPDILDVAVIGLPDKSFGESVTCIVVAREGCVLEVNDLVAFCRGRIGGYKIPRRLEKVAELPRNASGKVLKTELRKMFT